MRRRALNEKVMVGKEGRERERERKRERLELILGLLINFFLEDLGRLIFSESERGVPEGGKFLVSESLRPAIGSKSRGEREKDNMFQSVFCKTLVCGMFTDAWRAGN